jgi:hypothetical protein
MMELKEIRMIRRLVPRAEYLAYFRELGGNEEEPGHFLGPDWEAHVGESREAIILTCTIEEVEVIIRAPDDKIDAMVHAFRIKFMRAGA